MSKANPFHQPPDTIQKHINEKVETYIKTSLDELCEGDKSSTANTGIMSGLGSMKDETCEIGANCATEGLPETNLTDGMVESCHAAILLRCSDDLTTNPTNKHRDVWDIRL